MFRATLTLVLIIFSTAAWAANSQGQYIPYGASPCAEYVGAANAKENVPEAAWDNTRHLSWISGYITAINSHLYDGLDIMEEHDIQLLYTWVYTWCQDHGQETLADAMEELMNKLRKDGLSGKEIPASYGR